MLKTNQILYVARLLSSVAPADRRQLPASVAFFFRPLHMFFAPWQPGTLSFWQHRHFFSLPLRWNVHATHFVLAAHAAWHCSAPPYVPGKVVCGQGLIRSAPPMSVLLSTTPVGSPWQPL